jgi:hypothetical protein
MKREQVLEMFKLLVENARKSYKKQVNAGRREEDYGMGK